MSTTTPTTSDFPSASNFRPLPRVRPGTLYRSDHLGALDDEDAQQILLLGIRRVLDFRGVDERTTAACQLPGVAVHSLAIEPTIVQVLGGLVDAGHDVTAEETVAFMQETYRGFVRKSTNRFVEFFGHLLESNEPTVFHCTAGKDRTGFAAALVLHALHVPHEEVLRDYMLTNERFKPVARSTWRLPEHAAKVLQAVRPEFLQAAFTAIDEDYGGIDAYLRDGLGLHDRERKRLRELYLDTGH